MKRWAMLFLGLLAGPGCVELDVWLKDKQAAEAPAPLVAPARPRVVVNPGDVTERNAREVLDALRDELDRAEIDNRPTPAASDQAGRKK